MKSLERPYIITLVMKAMLTLWLIFITLTMKGQFSAPSYLTHEAGYNLQVVDLDNDGDLDCINIRGSGRNEFVIYENLDTIGHDWSIEIVPTITQLNYIHGDFNNDGWIDIISIGYDSSAIYINNGANDGISFTAQSIDFPNDHTIIQGVGRVNNDNTLDLLVTDYGDRTFSITENYYLQDSFALGFVSEPLPINWVFQNAKLIDVDGDDDLDVVAIIKRTDDEYQKELVWYKNEDTGDTFSDKKVIAGSPDCSSYLFGCMFDVEMGDFNGDNLLDVVYLDGHHLKFRYQLSNQNFSEVIDSIPVYVPLPIALNQISIGDIDNDGDLDVTRTGIHDSKFIWYKNTNGNFEVVEHCCYSKSLGIYSITPDTDPNSFLEDIDNDGDLDLIFMGDKNGYSGIFSMLNINHGISFSEPYKISENLNSPTTIISYDLENDGDNDLWYHDKGNDRIIFLRNEDGFGNFSAPISLLEENDIKQIEIYDIDSNGNDDIVGISSDGSVSQLFYYEILDSIPTLSNKHVIQYFNEEFVNFVFQDINNDDLIDIGIGGKEEIFWYKRNEYWGIDFTFMHTNIQGSLIGFGDADGNNLIDIYYYESSSDSTGVGYVYYPTNLYPRVALQNSIGNFNPIILNNQDGFMSFSVTDLNGDGKSELLAGKKISNNNHNIILFEQNGIEFQEYEIFAAANSNYYTNDPYVNFFTSDVDNDGKLDIIFGKNWFKQLSSHLDFSNNFFPDFHLEVLSISDLNNDNRKDFILGSSSNTYIDRTYWKENLTDQVYWVEGNMAKDEDENCLFNGSDAGLSNWKVQLENDSIRYFANTNSLGNFATFLPDTGEYVIKPISPSAYWNPCFSDSILQIYDSINAHVVNIPVGTHVDCPLLGLNDAATNLRPCISGRIIYKYCNYGTVTAENSQIEILVDEFLDINSTSIPIDITTDSSIIFNLGNVEIGDCGQVELVVTPDCDSTMVDDIICIDASITPNFVCSPLDSLWDGSTIVVDGFCTNDSTTFLIENIGVGDMAIPRDFRVQIVNDEIVMLIIQDTFQLVSGQIKTITVANNTDPLQIEADQDVNHPTATTASIVVGNCSGLTGMELANLISNFPDNDGNPFTEHLCITLTGPFDPNEKNAIPLGVSDQNFIDRDWTLDYTIHFQNVGNDYAVNVVIVDTLSEYLDISTLSIGAGSHQFDWTLNPDRSITFTFPNIYLPDSTTNLLESQGFVHFSILPKSDVLPSTEIVNRASIYFDANDPIVTNEVIRRIRIPTFATSQHTLICEGEEFLGQTVLTDTMMIDTLSNTPQGLYLHFHHLDIIPAVVLVDTMLQFGEIFNGVVITQDTVFEDFYVDMNGCEINVIINVQLPVDLIELEVINEIHIYPNPAYDFIIIEKQDERIKIEQVLIRNTSGAIINKISSLDLVNKKDQLSIVDLSPGMYILEVHTNIGILNKKMVVIQ